MNRIRVACINWGHPDAPHAHLSVVDPTGCLLLAVFCTTWQAAMDFADDLARQWRRP